MSNFFHMGGYAFFVWTSYGISLVILLLNIFLPIRREKQLIRSLAKRQQREEQRQ